ncbi:hypothetical protein AOQ72_18100 [Bradyrhizobium yuanmingense]|uniref:DUF8168 domain-containing protein n=1 Tax=Bradyrhizobium yuanmingense TaxID=108015 RepID=A0A0R3CFC7_9BRAD|nr:hypothetical protein [Bradyrhizobium yuanmingense]KRP96246.1 hypothetical protein AOQ72_18100 [Bradyrhizobium yuanmingense]
MKSCIVVGRIIPERANVRFGVDRFNFGLADFRGTGAAFAEFSQLSIHLDFEQDCGSPYDIVLVARSVAAPIVNYIAFTQTASYHLSFDMVIDVANRKHYPVTVAEPLFATETEPLHTFFKREEHAATLVPPSVFDPAMQRALDDLSNALRYPAFSPMYCRLAIETIRTSFDPQSESSAWTRLRESLCIRRETIDSFWKLAADQRHGRLVEHSWDERRSCLRIAWEIVNRFILLKADPTAKFESM